jgi:intein/homing endonuclease
MSSPNNQFLIIDKNGHRITIDEIFERYGNEEKRIIADDEIGKCLYVGDLEYYSAKELSNKQYICQRLNEVRSSRFSTELIRRQIGGTVLTMTADTVFLVKKDDHIIKVRAEDLKKGMILGTGEKVYL